MEILMQILNSDIVQMLIGSLIVFIILKLGGKFPSVKKFFDDYKGDMISIIKQVEIEFSTYTGDNKSIEKLRLAVQYMVDIIEKREQRVLTDAEKIIVRNNIVEVHQEVDASGVLNKVSS